LCTHFKEGCTSVSDHRGHGGSMHALTLPS
jgi:hypothetical protein